MSYYFAKTLETDFATAVERATAALKEHGFGVLTEIDIQATLKKKLDVDMPSYLILGACNPPHAYKALTAEPHIGLMLPCNVIVRDLGDGAIEVAAVDPMVSMGGVENPDLEGVAVEVRALLEETIASL